MIRRAMVIAAMALLSLTIGARGATVGKAAVSAEINPTTLKAGEQAVVTVTADIPEGLHAQSHTPSQKNFIPFKVTPQANDAVTWGEPVYPAGKNETYGTLGTLNVYTGKVVVTVPVAVKADPPGGPTTLSMQVQSQLCDDKACYPPQRPMAEVKVTIDAPLRAAATTQAAVAAPVSVGASKKEPWTVWTALGAALLAGLAFNIMPCVLPVLPLKAVGFYEASQHNRARSFTLGIVFSLGLIAVFAVLALFVLVLKLVAWGDLFSKWWFIWAVVALLIALAFGLLGAWNFALPLGVYRFEPRHDTYSGNFFWGALSAILATPCTAPLLPLVLAWATAQPVVIGVIAMLTVGVGMALPYLILSAFPEVARRFPRSGPWTELFKQMMGFLLLASAAYFGAGRLIHGTEFWWVVTAVVAIAALFLIARTVQLTKNARPVGIAATLAVMMLGGMLWWTGRITGLTSPAGAAVADSNWTAYSDEQFQSLRKAGKPVLVKFTANWCFTCQTIEGTVFRDPRVWEQLKSRGITALKVDFSDDSDAPGKQLLLSLNPTGGIPVTAIFPGGDRAPVVLTSVYTTSEMLEALSHLGS